MENEFRKVVKNAANEVFGSGGYIHWNPVKHGHVKNVIDWPYSSFHRFVKQGVYEENWGKSEVPDIKGIE
jgi:hypothetical protein